jgi:hypothetical protein
VLLAEAVLLGEARLLLARLGRGRWIQPGAGRRWAGRRRGLVGRPQVGALEQRIFGEVALQLLVELDRRQLQQADRLLELRSEGEVLR